MVPLRYNRAVANPVDDLELPTATDLAEHDIALIDEVHAGHQSRVFEADHNGERRVLKLTDSRFCDAAFGSRLEAAMVLATSNASVVGPIELNGSQSQRIGSWHAVVYPWVSGRPADSADSADVTAMARSLASLHAQLAKLPRTSIPPVLALRNLDRDSSRDQLLHGDFSDQNVLINEPKLSVIDFDDCGYGPIEFELGNTLFMVLFDAVTTDQREKYDDFRRWFLGTYEEESGSGVDSALVDDAVAIRRAALATWVADPSSAPAGIRTATPEWHEELRRFLSTTLLGGEEP